MIEKMRESAKSGWTIILFAIITVVFALSFGAPMDGCQQGSGPQRAATVAGTTVMTDEVGILYNRAGSRKTDTESDIVAAQAQALKGLVVLHLLAKEAEDMGLRVSDEELKDYIKDPLRNAEYQVFYGNRGSFSGGYYKRFIENQLRVSRKRYEEFKRVELLAKKYLELVEMQVGALPGEVEALDALRNHKANLSYVKIAPDDIKSQINPTPQDIDAYIAQNAATIKLQYEKDKEQEYTEPAQVRIRRIYITKPDKVSGSDAERTQKQEKFAQAKARVMEKKEDFAAVAGELSEDTSKEQGGLMDWAQTENLDQAIVKALEGSKDGEVREVEVEYAYMLVKVEERKAEQVKALEDVQVDIARAQLQDALVAKKVDELTKAFTAQLTLTPSLQGALDALKTPAKEGESVPAPEKEGEEVAQAPGSLWDSLSVRETGLFSLEGQDLSALFGGRLPPGVEIPMGEWDRIPGIGKSKAVALEAFKLTKESPLSTQNPYEVDGAPVFVELKELKLAPEKKEDEEAAGDPMAELRDEVRSKRLRTFASGWQSLFLIPSPDLGPWLDALYDTALKENRIVFNDKVRMAKVLKDTAPALELTAGGSPESEENGEKAAATTSATAK